MSLVINDVAIYRADNINMLGSPGALATLQLSSLLLAATLANWGNLRFIPQFAYMHLRTMTGTLTTSPGVRIGTNGTHNNIAPIFIPPTSIVVGQIGSIPLTTPLIAPPVTTSDIILEITQSAVGPSVMTGDVLLTGILVG